MSWEVISPPAHWFDKPRPEILNIRLQSRADVYEVCQRATGKADQFGCAIVWPDKCDVYIADDLPQMLRDQVQIHEVGHCHGWPGNHPVN